MEKKYLILVLTFTFALGLFLTGCEKDEQNSPVEPDMNETATLKGVVYADLDERNNYVDGNPNANNVEYGGVPQGTTIRFRVSAIQYATNADGYHMYTAEANSDGEYEIDIPAVKAGVAVEILPGDFEYDKHKAEGDYNLTTQTWDIDYLGRERTIYTHPGMTVGDLIPGAVKYAPDIVYVEN